MTSLPEVALEPGTAVLCDLHLDLGSEDPSSRFEQVLAQLGSAPRVVILGDLFDYWVGPAQLRLPGSDRILSALARLTAGGTALDVLLGNRDFLLGKAFVERTGARIHRDGFLGKRPDGARSVLIHGDELCTLDHDYQRLKRVLRSRFVGWLAPRIPFSLSQRIAKRLRRASTAALRIKPVEEKSMQRSACDELARELRADDVICGHAHSFRDEVVATDSRWVVLDAFGGKRDMLVLSPSGWEVRCSREGVTIPRS